MPVNATAKIEVGVEATLLPVVLAVLKQSGKAPRLRECQQKREKGRMQLILPMFGLRVVLRAYTENDTCYKASLKKMSAQRVHSNFGAKIGVGE